MQSRWLNLKPRAIQLRKRGCSIGNIEARLGIPRSTLSGWFRNITLSDHHKRRLKLRHEQALVRARKEAVKWHNSQKAARLALAEQSAKETLSRIDMNKKEIVELSLAMLYFGEGSKTNSQTAMGNSDPLILKFFVHALKRLYGLSSSDFSCHLHLRADQNPTKMTKYWSATLGIPLRNFGKSIIDKRTAGSPTYPHYKGVCAVNCSRVAIQRKIMYLYDLYCRQIILSASRD